MGGFFGVASANDCVFDLFFGTDYHSHLGTKRGGMTVYGADGFDRAIHNIANSPFRTKFENDVNQMHGNLGIGCISDNEPQPLIVRSHLGNFSLTTVGRINNSDELVEMLYKEGTPHFLEMSGGEINQTELVASLINTKSSFVEGIRYAQEKIDGSMSILLMTPKEIYAARDYYGRTPISVGKKEGSYCVAFESFSYINLGYSWVRDLGAAEIVRITPEVCETVLLPQKKMKICTFLWVYFGYVTSCYEGIDVESMRYRCGEALAKRDTVKPDTIAGVPDSGTAHAIGYAHASGVRFTRPLIKYTPTWPRSFMPQNQKQRDLIAHMKLLPIHGLIENKRLMFIDDSVVRGTQMRDTAQFLFENGAKEVHVRSACPPIMFGCKYLNFSRSTSEMDLIARRVIAEHGNDPYNISEAYLNPETEEFNKMVNDISAKLHFTSLLYNRLDDMKNAVGIDPCCLCTYCWDGKE